jgi:hypothetical protein
VKVCAFAVGGLGPAVALDPHAPPIAVTPHPHAPPVVVASDPRSPRPAGAPSVRSPHPRSRQTRCHPTVPVVAPRPAVAITCGRWRWSWTRGRLPDPHAPPPLGPARAPSRAVLALRRLRVQNQTLNPQSPIFPFCALSFIHLEVANCRLERGGGCCEEDILCLLMSLSSIDCKSHRIV